MKRSAWIAVGLFACGPQVTVDDDGGAVGSTGGDDGTATTQSVPSNPSSPATSEPCPDGVCEDDSEDGTPPDPSDASETATDGPVPPPPELMCMEHAECDTLLCVEFSDAPPDLEASCAEAPADGSTRFTGTVRSLSTQAVAAGAGVLVAGALEAFTNPAGAMGLVATVTDGEGRFDVTSGGPVAAQIGVVAIASLPNFQLSLTALAGPQVDGAYLPGNDVHDVWVVDQADVDLWNQQLGPEGLPPLGEEGGFIGLARGADGVPLAGVVVATGAGSSAVVRYPTAGGMDEMATSEAGLFIVLNAGLGESVDLVGPDGTSVGPIVIGDSPGAIMTAGVIVP